MVYGGRPDAWRESIERTKAATPASVGAAAKRWLSDGVFVLEVQPFPTMAAAKAGVDRKTRPEPGPMPEGRFPAFQRAKLTNGLKVIVAERHAIPAVEMRLLVDAGYASDSAATAGLARLAADMMDEGTKSRSALQISSELQRRGAQLTTASDLDSTVVSLSALRANLEPSLELMADVVVNPSFPASDFDRLQKQQLAAIEQEGVRPNAMALRVLPGLLYGPGHAYANPFTGSGFKATVEKLTRDDAARWHATWFRPGSATLLVVGDTTLAEVTPRLEKAFASWAPGTAPAKNVAPVEPKGPSAVYILDRPGALQSFIVAGNVAPPRANPDQIPQAVTNMVLGGQFISRINMNLREDKHWSYGASTNLVDARGPRPFFAMAPVQTDKTKESAAEILEEMKGIRGEKPVSPEELRAAQDGLVLTLPGEWETSRAVAGSLAEIIRFGFDDRYYDSYAAKVRAVTVADAGRAAAIVQPDKLVWVIAGDRAKVEAGLKELGLGAVRTIDADGNVLP
jgi:zinc protease